MNSLPTINRVEIIDYTVKEPGRVFVKWSDDIQVETSVQDEGKTLKIFINKKGEPWIKILY